MTMANLSWLLPFIFYAVKQLGNTAGPFEANVSSVRANVSEDGRPLEEWGYTNVRPGAHMFWWLQYTTHSDGFLHRPWILWLQGGPGLSGAALGNFAEIGPLDVNFQPRPTTWLQTASLLFVDSPVGTGLSYADSAADVPRGLRAICADLITFLNLFLRAHPEFKTRPLSIMGQSYGGKMVVGLAYHLTQEMRKGNIEINLQSIGIGNGWVSSIHFIQSWPPMLYYMSMIDEQADAKMAVLVDSFRRNTGVKAWRETHALFIRLLQEMSVATDGWLNVYNILEPNPKHETRTRRSLPVEMAEDVPLSIYDIDMEPFMNGPVRDRLHIIPTHVKFGEQKGWVSAAQLDDMMEPVVDIVDWLLNSTDIQVAVYQGQLDLICSTVGAMGWIQELQWSGLARFNSTSRGSLLDPSTGKLEMFVKAFDRLKFYWVLNSGHAVPADRPEAGLRLINRILDNVDT